MLIMRTIICRVILAMTIVILNNLILVSTKTGRKNLHKLGAISNDFALKLLRELKAKDETGNIFISPLSISMTFGMLYYGAAGNTAEDLKDALGYKKEGMTKEIVDLTFKRFLTNELRKSANFNLNAANAILVDNKLGLLPDFKKKVQETYFANVKSVDFQTNTSEILKDINSWVSKQTNGKIPKLLDSLDKKTVFIILNAVYFKSLWKYPFDPKNNRWQIFLNNNKEFEAKSIQMMRMTKRFGIANISDCEALELPYIVDNVVMLIMMPKRGLKYLEQELSHISIVKILKAMRYTRINAVIPKFKIEFNRSLVPELTRLGVRTVFEDVDFSGMIKNESIPINEFLHKAVIEVNEEGTEAAAATATKTTKSLIPSFIVNRPFVFAIIDKRINFVFFLGRVSNLQ